MIIRNGTAGPDTLIGTYDAEEFIGGEGEDIAYGNGGLDRFDGGAGGDSLYGASEADTLLGGDGDDSLYGNDGQDLYEGGDGDDVLYGGNDADTMSGGEDNDVLYGNQGDDVLVGGAGSDSLYGTGGADRIEGDGPDATTALSGISYDDLIEAGEGSDTIAGGVGNDEMQGEGGDDTISGGQDGGLLVHADTGAGGNTGGGGTGSGGTGSGGTGPTTGESGDGDAACLQDLIDAAGGAAVTLDVTGRIGLGGNLGLSLDGLAYAAGTPAGGISALVGTQAWTMFCAQLPEALPEAPTAYVTEGVDEVLALSDDTATTGVTPSQFSFSIGTRHDGSTGSTPRVDVTVARQHDGTLRFDLTLVPVDGVVADLRGLFFHVADESLVGSLSASSSATIGGKPLLTGSARGADAVSKVSGGMNMEGVKQGPYDFAVEFGTTGIGKDDVRSASFVLDSSTTDLTLELVEQMGFGARMTSVGTVSSGRGGSLKLVGTAGEATPTPGTTPTAETIRRDAALEEGQTWLTHQLFELLGADGCGLQGFTAGGAQDLIGVAGSLPLQQLEASAAQLLLYEIAYDYDGGRLSSLDLAGGRFTATGPGVTQELRTAFDLLKGKLEVALPEAATPLAALSAPAVASAAEEPGLGALTGVVIGDNLYGNGGQDRFDYERGDGVDLIWDFDPTQDLIVIRGYDIADVDGFTFVTRVTNLGRDGSHPLDAGEYLKLAILLDQAGNDAILFNDMPNRDSMRAAFQFDDGTLSVAQVVARANAAVAAAAPTAVAAGEDVTARLEVVNSWWGGFQGQITVTAARDMVEWDLELGSRYEVSQVWNAEMAGATAAGSGGLVYTLEDAGWNGTLRAGQSVTLGFVAQTGVAGVVGAPELLDGLWIA